MAKIGDINTLLAEQAIKKAVTAYSRGCDRCDLEIFKSAFHLDAEVRYGTYDGHYEKFCEDIVNGNLSLQDTSISNSSVSAIPLIFSSKASN